MELKKLLDDNNWDDPVLEINESSLAKSRRSGIQKGIRKLFLNYYKSIGLNLSFLIITVSLYFFRPIPDILLPIFIISSCFIYLLITVVLHLLGREKLDPTLSLKVLLESTLAFNKKIHRNVCAYQSYIFSASFLGGFLMGIILQGWTLEKIIAEPIVLSILGVGTIGAYFLSKSTNFAQFNRSMNPGYVKAKKYLEEQLDALKEEEIDSF